MGRTGLICGDIAVAGAIVLFNGCALQIRSCRACVKYKNPRLLLPMLRYLLFIPLFCLTGCLGMPEGVQPVDNFNLQRYLGTWYEIARLDHSFEEGLSSVTAEYSIREDGGVRVLNRGWSAENQAWEEAEGKAYFVEDNDTGYLKVSFFGPFYGSYVVFDLDQEDYGYSFVSGPDTSYLWLLSRTPTVQPAILDRFLAQARLLGFDTDALINVPQDRYLQDN
jgi:apolipoprotein D and lipocalin family protein